ncbi:MAG: hypothetical protein JO145_13950 [Acidobacteriaceae bacterium]|nr:hypothetical protein [Acidobacteriaceae bacterium]
MDSFTAEDEHLDFSPQEFIPPRDRSNGNSRYSTGPRSPDGKAASSQNARTHGCCSKALLLPGESQDDFDDLHDRWISACQPDTLAATELVQKLRVEKWYLQRTPVCLRDHTAISRREQAARIHEHVGPHTALRLGAQSGTSKPTRKACPRVVQMTDDTETDPNSIRKR